VPFAIASAPIQPSADGPIAQPATISPTTPGRRSRCAISAPICAATKTMTRVSRMALA
jgi:hypothetical protein